MFYMKMKQMKQILTANIIPEFLYRVSKYSVKITSPYMAVLTKHL